MSESTAVTTYARTDAQLLDAIEADLKACLVEVPGAGKLPANLGAALEYALMGPGKRTRPMLALRCADAVGGDWQAALPAASAVEMIHAFSLVHDDLPTLDDDDLRRGRPTTHIAHGEPMALLAGDGLQNLAFQTLVTRAGEQAQDKVLAAELVAELSQGTTAMIAGQVLDTLGGFGPELEDDLAKLRAIHENKTGALIIAACRMGARAGLATSELGEAAAAKALEAITTYAYSIGLMFQIVDDLLDVEQTAEQIGKATGKDADLGKLTYPGILGVEASRAEIEKLRQAAAAALKTLPGETGPLGVLNEKLATRTK